MDCGWRQTVFEVTGLRVELWVPRDGFPKRIQTKEGKSNRAREREI